MKSKIVNWLKKHRTLRATTPFIVLALILCGLMIPVNAQLEYLDVEGVYTVSARAGTTYMDGARHPLMNFDVLTITTQTDQVISSATLTTFGKDIALVGLVGPGSRPNIVLGGTDSVGTVVSITGRVTTNAAGAVTGISGRIQGYVTSDGEKKVNAGTGTAASSVVAAHSGEYSTLITQGAGAGSVGIQLNHPQNRIKLSQLDSLIAGRLGFWFNLQDTTTPGPYIGLRFAAPGVTETDLFSDVDGHVDITIMPYQAFTGDGLWHECQLTSASGRCVYYGNDPTDGTAFSWEEEAGNYTLADIQALVNAETAMTAGDDSASNWLLTTVYIVLYEGGVKTCYVDDINVNGTIYTLEPEVVTGTFRAKIAAD